MAYEPKPLKFDMKSLEGISSKTLETHWGKLYQGYVKKYNEIQEKLESVNQAEANASQSEWRDLQQGETFTCDGIILHELYFDNLGGKGLPRGLEVGRAIIDQFGSMDGFKGVLTASGMGARGWVVLAVNPLDAKLHCYACDAHNQGGIWGAIPILVLDVYEHAYFIDYGSDRKGYIEAFWKNIDWDMVNKRFLSAV
ncbi:MAG: superoxide dismutase [bacterium]|nr:superoxide dismutase [bacterium]